MEYFKRKRDKSKDDRSEKNRKYKSLVASTKRDKQPTEPALTAPHKAFTDLGATAYMMKDMPVNTGKAVPLNISIVTAGRDTMKETAQDESVFRLSTEEKPVILNQVLHVPEAEHSLVFVSSFCEDDHTMALTRKKCIVKKENYVIGVGERAGGI